MQLRQKPVVDTLSAAAAALPVPNLAVCRGAILSRGP